MNTYVLNLSGKEKQHIFIRIITAHELLWFSVSGYPGKHQVSDPKIL